MIRLYSARDHLDNAARSLSMLENPKHSSDLSAGFGGFLSSMRTFYSHLTQFAKQSAGLKKWFDEIKRENKSDELMYFFSQARDQTDHGGNAPIDISWSVKMDVSGKGSVISSRLGPAWDLSPDLTEKNVSYNFKLISFTNARSKQEIGIPTSHFGYPISDEALSAASLVFKRMKLTFDTAWSMAHMPELKN